MVTVTVGLPKRTLLTLTLLLWLLPQFMLCATEQVTLAWQASSGSGIAGYNIYYGLASGNYTSKVSVTGTTQTTITGLMEGRIYYFVVTAFTTTGLESLPSNQVSFQAPGAMLQMRRIHTPGLPDSYVVLTPDVVGIFLDAPNLA